MERKKKKIKILLSKRKEARGLLRKCFKSGFFSLVPFEIWMDIVGNADMKSFAFLSQTCWAFKELVEFIGEKNLRIALLFRKEGQIVLAMKYLEKCAYNGNPIAMFHLANTNWGGGPRANETKAAEWLKKAAELGVGVASYAFCLKNGFGAEKDVELSEVWAKKALASDDTLAVACCHNFGLGTPTNKVKAFEYFQIAANQGDEYAQNHLGFCLKHECGTERDYDKAFYWYSKAAEQGFGVAQYEIGYMYLHGEGCEKDRETAHSWFKKAARQGNVLAFNYLAMNG